MRLDERHNNTRLAVRTGDTILLHLTENSGGGYRWTVTSVDAATLEMVEHHYEDTRAGVGSAGASVWTFIARKPGHARLELANVRPWSPGDAAGNRFAVDVEIAAASQSNPLN